VNNFPFQNIFSHLSNFQIKSWENTMKEIDQNFTCEAQNLNIDLLLAITCGPCPQSLPMPLTTNREQSQNSGILFNSPLNSITNEVAVSPQN